MPEQQKMIIDARYQYLNVMREHYEKADRRKRGQLLDEMERATQLDCRTLTRHMRRRVIARRPRLRQRGKTYGHHMEG